MTILYSHNSICQTYAEHFKSYSAAVNASKMSKMMIIPNYEVFLTTSCGTGGFVKTIPSALAAPICVHEDNGYNDDDGDDTFKCFRPARFPLFF